MNQKVFRSKTARVREFDIARAIAVVLMIAVHTEFAVYNYQTPRFGTLIDYLGSPFCAPIYMFILGANIFLSSRNSAKQLFTRGVSIFSLSILFNIVCHALPFFILDFINQKTMYTENALHWIFAVDILTFAGMVFIFFAAVRKFKIKNPVLIAIGIISSIVNTVLTRHCPIDFNGHPILASITGLFYNSSITGYFSFLSWIIFPIAGYIFMQVYVAIQDKKRFYRIAGGTGLVIYLICIAVSYKWFPHLPFVEYVEEYSYYQMHPFNAFGTLAFCLAWLGFLYFTGKFIPKAFDRHITRLNKNLTVIYVIQWFVINYALVLAFNGTLSVNEWQYLLCVLFVGIVSDFTARCYTKYKAWEKKS